MANLSKSLEEASRWYAKIATRNFSQEDALSLEHWQNLNEENKHAWQVVEKVNGKFKGIDAAIAKSTLNCPSASRRDLIKNFAILTSLGSLSWFMAKEQPWLQLLADQTTMVGEVKSMLLADGTQLYINTDSAVNIVMNEQQRLVELLQGEVLIETGKNALMQAPFRVKTQHGVITAHGTRFNVRDHGAFTRVSLFEGKLSIASKDNNSQQVFLNAGEELSFSAVAPTQKGLAKSASSAWKNGLLVVYAIPLYQFVEELSRYKKGVLRCDPKVANLLISGAFSIKDTDSTLIKLTEILPVKVEKYTSYWSMINAL